ncbi:ATP-binding protein [Streptomyces sp. NPDC048527]|uniref:ATP-binding protein n=1 Tax=Streptomyces sp. NPDC048527 TaxID=3365568 RepID=UPI003715CEC2
MGRDAEVAVAGGLVEEIVGGRGRAVLIVGEAGIGKSTLVAAVLEDARLAEHGCEILRGACDVVARGLPLWVMREALGVDPASSDPRRAKTAEALSKPWEATGSRLLIMPGDPVAAASEQLLSLLDQLCARGPVVLAVDDLQWADDATLLMWRMLCRSVAQLPLLLIGTCRPLPRRDELDRLRRDVLDHDGVVLPLEALPASSASQLAERLLGAVPGSRLTEQLAQAGGNPFYIRELLDALVRENMLSVQEGISDLAVLDPTAPVPVVSPTGAIVGRLNYLSEQARELLRTAALMGPDFSVWDLATAVAGDTAALAATIEETLLAGVLQEAGPRLRFRHGLLKQALYEAIPQSERATLHEHAAEALSASGAPLERVAQLIMNQPGEAYGWELEWLAENSTELAYRAPDLAARLIEQALPQMAVSDPRRADLEQQLAVLGFLLARHEQVESITSRILAGTELAERRGPAAWLLAYTHLRHGRAAEALEVVSAEAESTQESPLWRARLIALRSLGLVIEGRGAEARSVALRALALGRELGDPTTTAYAHHSMAMTEVRDRHPQEALVHIEAALAAIGDDAQQIDLRLLLQGNQMTVLADLDRFDEIAAVLPHTLALAERSGTPRLAQLHMQASGVSFIQGRWDDALTELEATAHLPDSAFSPLMYQGVIALIAVHRADRRTARKSLQIFKEHTSTSAWLPTARTKLLVAQALTFEQDGRLRDAADTLATLLSSEYTAGVEDRADWLPTLVRVAIAAQAPGLARAGATACREEAAQSHLPRKRASAAWCQGLVEGDPAPVLEAVAYFRACGRRVSLAHALEDAAELQASAGAPEAAKTSLIEAVTLYGELGAVSDSKRATARLRVHGITSGGRGSRAARPQTGWGALTATELRVAREVAQGSSNLEVASQLLLSRRTVETHVSHILVKLQIRSRHGIAQAAGAREDLG